MVLATSFPAGSCLCLVIPPSPMIRDKHTPKCGKIWTNDRDECIADKFGWTSAISRLFLQCEMWLWGRADAGGATPTPHNEVSGDLPQAASPNPHNCIRWPDNTSLSAWRACEASWIIFNPCMSGLWRADSSRNCGVGLFSQWEGHRSKAMQAPVLSVSLMGPGIYSYFLVVFDLCLTIMWLPREE